MVISVLPNNSENMIHMQNQNFIWILMEYPWNLSEKIIKNTKYAEIGRNQQIFRISELFLYGFTWNLKVKNLKAKSLGSKLLNLKYFSRSGSNFTTLGSFSQILANFRELYDFNAFLWMVIDFLQNLANSDEYMIQRQWFAVLWRRRAYVYVRK